MEENNGVKLMDICVDDYIIEAIEKIANSPRLNNPHVCYKEPVQRWQVEKVVKAVLIFHNEVESLRGKLE